MKRNVSYHNAISGDKLEMNELRRRREQNRFRCRRRLVNPVSPEVTGRISGRERDGRTVKENRRQERERERESRLPLVTIIRAEVGQALSTEIRSILIHPDSQQLCRRRSQHFLPFTSVFEGEERKL